MRSEASVSCCSQAERPHSQRALIRKLAQLMPTAMMAPPTAMTDHERLRCLLLMIRLARRHSERERLTMPALHRCDPQLAASAPERAAAEPAGDGWMRGRREGCRAGEGNAAMRCMCGAACIERGTYEGCGCGADHQMRGRVHDAELVWAACGCAVTPPGDDLHQ